MLLAVLIDDVDMVACFLATDLNVLPKLDRALGAQNEGASVAPRAQALRRKPIYADIV